MKLAYCERSDCIVLAHPVAFDQYDQRYSWMTSAILPFRGKLRNFADIPKDFDGLFKLYHSNELNRMIKHESGIKQQRTKHAEQQSKLAELARLGGQHWRRVRNARRAGARAADRAQRKEKARAENAKAEYKRPG